MQINFRTSASPGEYLDSHAYDGAAAVPVASVDIIRNTFDFWALVADLYEGAIERLVKPYAVDGALSWRYVDDSRDRDGWGTQLGVCPTRIASPQSTTAKSWRMQAYMRALSERTSDPLALSDLKRFGNSWLWRSMLAAAFHNLDGSVVIFDNSNCQEYTVYPPCPATGDAPLYNGFSDVWIDSIADYGPRDFEPTLAALGFGAADPLETAVMAALAALGCGGSRTPIQNTLFFAPADALCCGDTATRLLNHNIVTGSSTSLQDTTRLNIMLLRAAASAIVHQAAHWAKLPAVKWGIPHTTTTITTTYSVAEDGTATQINTSTSSQTENLDRLEYARQISSTTNAWERTGAYGEFRWVCSIPQGAIPMMTDEEASHPTQEEKDEAERLKAAWTAAEQAAAAAEDAESAAESWGDDWTGRLDDYCWRTETQMPQTIGPNGWTDIDAVHTDALAWYADERTKLENVIRLKSAYDSAAAYEQDKHEDWSSAADNLLLLLDSVVAIPWYIDYPGGKAYIDDWHSRALTAFANKTDGAADMTDEEIAACSQALAAEYNDSGWTSAWDAYSRAAVAAANAKTAWQQAVAASDWATEEKDPSETLDALEDSLAHLVAAKTAAEPLWDAYVEAMAAASAARTAAQTAKAAYEDYEAEHKVTPYPGMKAYRKYTALQLAGGDMRNWIGSGWTSKVNWPSDELLNMPITLTVVQRLKVPDLGNVTVGLQGDPDNDLGEENFDLWPYSAVRNKRVVAPQKIVDTLGGKVYDPAEGWVDTVTPRGTKYRLASVDATGGDNSDALLDIFDQFADDLSARTSSAATTMPPIPPLGKVPRHDPDDIAEEGLLTEGDVFELCWERVSDGGWQGPTFRNPDGSDTSDQPQKQIVLSSPISSQRATCPEMSEACVLTPSPAAFVRAEFNFNHIRRR